MIKVIFLIFLFVIRLKGYNFRRKNQEKHIKISLIMW